MKKILIALIASSFAFTAAAADVEATFERTADSVCYVKQDANELYGELALKGETAKAVSTEVVSNTDDITLKYTSLTVNNGDFSNADVTFKINGATATLDEEVTVPSGFVGLTMKLETLGHGDFAAGSELSATATLEVECEDENTIPSGECDDDDFDPASGMWCPDYFEPDTDSDK